MPDDDETSTRIRKAVQQVMRDPNIIDDLLSPSGRARNERLSSVGLEDVSRAEFREYLMSRGVIGHTHNAPGGPSVQRPVEWVAAIATLAIAL
jgi:hypothetical protein